MRRSKSARHFMVGHLQPAKSKRCLLVELWWCDRFYTMQYRSHGLSYLGFVARGALA